MYLLLGSHTALSHFAECLGGLNRWSSLLSACAGHLKALVYVQTEDGFSPLSLGVNLDSFSSCLSSSWYSSHAQVFPHSTPSLLGSSAICPNHISDSSLLQPWRSATLV